MIGLVVASIAAGFLIWNNRPAHINPEDFFRPDLVRDIAAQFPDGEDDFILAAWDYVGKTITYEPIGSDMLFVNGEIICEDCYMPNATLSREQGNCVAKSSLLASLLATRIPADRIHIIIGSYGPNREEGGHAWVELYRQSAWYLLEATKAPPANPWVTADSQFPLYDPGVMITPGEVLCADEFYCSTYSGCNCANLRPV